MSPRGGLLASSRCAFNIIFIIIIVVHVCAGLHRSALTHSWLTGDNFVEPVLSSYHVGSRGRSQVLRNHLPKQSLTRTKSYFSFPPT